MNGKDAFLSTTNIGALASLVVAILAANGIATDVTTVAAIISFAVTVWGRWRAGGISSAAGVTIPQPGQEQKQ